MAPSSFRRPVAHASKYAYHPEVISDIFCWVCSHLSGIVLDLRGQDAMGGSGGNTVNYSQDRQNKDQDRKKGWFQRSLEFWTPFWIMVAGVCAIVLALLTFVLVAQASKPSPGPSASPTSPSLSPTPISASHIANDVTGNTVNVSRHSGATVTSATCYQNSVGQSGNGTAYAECDLTYSDGAVFHSTVTDDDGHASSQQQYQENLSASDIANYAVGDTVTSGINTSATVTSATCYTAQLQNSGWTYATCNLYLSDGALIDAIVEDNGIRSEFQS